ncbi:N-acetylmuramoyl-L-alanine amidase [Clostridium thermobutyricum]|nr:N-acetylmuramoyl-L-alanine amidase [Clostridium thermobutyricum]
MNRRKLKNIIKSTILIMAISVFGSEMSVEAKTNTENEFISVMEEYKDEKVTVENGISLRYGETLNLAQYEGWKLSNNNVIEIENGIAKPKKSGIVFLSNKIGDTVHIIEVYVPENTTVYNIARNKQVDRNYYKVFIDPGHGGHDNGASGNGIKEDEFNLSLSFRLKKHLENRGIEVKMSREADIYLDLKERTDMANAYESDLFISTHANSADSTSANGIETYYHNSKAQDKPLSDKIQTNAIKETNAVNRGVKTENFAVLRESKMISSLFESGFISNSNEASKLQTPEYQEKLAKAIADGIETYLKENIQLKPEESKPEPPAEESKPEPPAEESKPEPPVEESKPIPPVEESKPTPPVEESKPNEPLKEKTGVVTASVLNVRNGAGTNNKVIGSFKKGSKVTIVETKNGWHKVKYGNGYGYVSADYVKVEGNNTTTKPNQTPSNSTNKTGTVTASVLNVRNGAGTNNKVIGSFKKGSKVTIVETKNGWHKVKYGNGYGYVSADYVKVEGNNTTTKPNQTPSNSTNKTGAVTASVLNVRNRAGTNNKVIGSFKKGSKVTIVETKNGWHKVKYGNSYGYVSADYVKVEGNNTTTKPNQTPSNSTNKTGTVTASVLNVRNGAGTNNKVIGSLKKNSKITIVETKNGWHKIRYGNGYGYVSAQYVK